MGVPYEQHYFEGISVWFGRDEDGDLFVSINTEDAEEGVNDEEGYPQIWVYLNHATINDPKEQEVVHPAHRLGGVDHHG